VSALRDEIIVLYENGGLLSDENKADLLQAFEWFKDGHEHENNLENWTTLKKLIEQMRG